MSGIEKALTWLSSIERDVTAESILSRLDARAILVVTLVYLILLLSFSLHALAGIIIFAVWPVMAAPLAGVSYSAILRRSLPVLPLIAFVGIFNPLFNREIAFHLGRVGISYGWLEFASILVRGLLAVQAVLILICTTGFYGICRSLCSLGVPALFTSQLMFVYRYIFVLAEEAASMDRARRARSFGRRSYSLRMYATFVGQLLIRTVARSKRIYGAMLARGYDGSIPASFYAQPRWQWRDTLFILLCSAAFAAGRWCDVGALFNHLH